MDGSGDSHEDATGAPGAAVRTRAGGGPLLFRNEDGKPIFDKRLHRLLRKLEIMAVPHGFRSSYRDWAAEETDHPREVVEAACRRSDLFERRRRLMEDWSSYLDSSHMAARYDTPQEGDE